MATFDLSAKIWCVRSLPGKGVVFKTLEFFHDQDEAIELATQLSNRYGADSFSLEGMPLIDGVSAMVEWLNKQVK